MSYESPSDASPADAARALADDLHAAADRARDERIQLAQALRLAGQVPPAAPEPLPPVPPTPASAALRAEQLAESLVKIDAVIRSRLDTLNQTQARIDEGERRLVTLERSIRQATDGFVEKVNQARVVAQAQQVSKAQAPPSASAPKLPDAAAVAQRLEQLGELDQSIDKRIARLQQMHKQAGEVVDRCLKSAVGEIEEKAAELAAPIQAEVERLLARQAKHAEAELAKRLAALEEQSRSHLRKQLAGLRDEAVRMTEQAAVVAGRDTLQAPMHAIATRLQHHPQAHPRQGAA